MAVAVHVGLWSLWKDLVQPAKAVPVPLASMQPLPTVVATIEIKLVRSDDKPAEQALMPTVAADSAAPKSIAIVAPTKRLSADAVSVSGQKGVEQPPDTSMADGKPARPTIGTDVVTDVVRGLDARGPQPTRITLAAALDYEGKGEREGRPLDDAGRAGKVAARTIALANAAGRHGHSWLGDVGRSIERRYAPTPQDLSNPKHVSREKIIANYLLDITQWDDDAKKALTNFYEAEALHSQDPIKRLSSLLGRVGQVENPAEREQRLWQLITKREQGMSVRFAFPVEVHHDGVGRPTAVDVQLADHERGLDRLIRSSIDAALSEAPPAPPDASGGRPFISHWVISSTWFMDPPRPMFPSSDTPETLLFPKIATTFDVSKDGITTQDFNVHQRIDVELRAVEIIGNGPG